MRLRMLLGVGLMAVAVLVILLGFGGSSSPEEAAIKESIGMTNAMCTVLEAVQDAQSAQEAQRKLIPFRDRADALGKKIKELSKEKLEAAGKKYEREWKTAADRFAEAMEKAVAAGFRMN